MLSIVIPTRDRPERLRSTLESLRHLETPEGAWEVIVVDDGSEHPIEQSLSSVPSLPGLRFVRQAPSGLNVARNRGADESQGDLIGFLDDDTLVDPLWGRAIESAFVRDDCAAVGGRVRLLFEATVPPWLTPKLRRYLAEYDLGEEPQWIVADPVPVGANFAVRRSTIEDTGGFLSGLDRIGSSLVSNGDTEFFRRLLASGRQIFYEPRAGVRHCVPAERLTSDFFARRAHAQGRSDAMLKLAATGRAGTRRREFVRAGRCVPILARSVVEGRGLTGPKFWLQYCRGRASVIVGESSTSSTLSAVTND